MESFLTLPPADSVLAASVGALVMGLTGSVHCLLMCGPLACAALPAPSGAGRTRALGAYQLGRVGAYVLIGALLGALGGGVGRALALSTRPYLPWVMAAALVASALGLGKRLPSLPGLARVAAHVARAGAKFSFPVRAGAIGAATPLLPCGLLYGVYAAALTTNSSIAGAMLLGGFALGGVPALLAVQLQLGRFSSRPRLAAFVLQRALPLLAAAVLVYRAVGDAAGARCH
jgi:uncharacterized protein